MRKQGCCRNNVKKRGVGPVMLRANQKPEHGARVTEGCGVGSSSTSNAPGNAGENQPKIVGTLFWVGDVRPETLTRRGMNTLRGSSTVSTLGCSSTRKHETARGYYVGIPWRRCYLPELLRPGHELGLHILEKQSGELVDQVTDPRGILKKRQHGCGRAGKRAGADLSREVRAEELYG